MHQMQNGPARNAGPFLIHLEAVAEGMVWASKPPRPCRAEAEVHDDRNAKRGEDQPEIARRLVGVPEVGLSSEVEKC